MTKEDLKYIAKVIRRYCTKNKYNATVLPDYETGHIEITGLPVGVKVLDVCKVVVDKGVKVFSKSDTKVLVKF